MKNAEQFNDSLQFIAKSVPSMIRSAYALFVEVNKEFAQGIYDATSIDSVKKDKFEKIYKEGFPFLEKIKMLNFPLYINTLRKIQGLSCSSGVNYRVGRDAFLEESTTYVERIQFKSTMLIKVSPLLNNYDDTMASGINKIPIMIIPKFNMWKNYIPTSGIDGYMPNRVEGQFGEPDMFSFIEAQIYLDILYLFDSFYKVFYKKNMSFLDRSFNTDSVLDEYIEVTKVSNFDDMMPFIEQLSTDVTNSALLTFIGFNGRILGSRKNFIDWFMGEVVPKFKDDFQNVVPSGGDSTDKNSNFENLLVINYTNASQIINAVITSDKYRDNPYIDAVMRAIEAYFGATYGMFNTTCINVNGKPVRMASLIELAYKRISTLDILERIKDLANIGVGRHFFDFDTSETENVYALMEKSSYYLGDLIFHSLYLSTINLAYSKLSGSADHKNDFDNVDGASYKSAIVSSYNKYLNKYRNLLKNLKNRDMNFTTMITRLANNMKTIAKTQNQVYTSKELDEYKDKVYNEFRRGTFSEKEIKEQDYLESDFYLMLPECFIINTGLSENSIVSQIWSYDVSDNENALKLIKESNIINNSLTGFNKIISEYRKVPSELANATLESLEEGIKELESSENMGINSNYNMFSNMTEGTIMVENEEDAIIAKDENVSEEALKKHKAKKKKISSLKKKLAELIMKSHLNKSPV